MNQSKLEANTCGRGETRENACERDMIGFGSTSDWLTRWDEFFLANHSAQYCRNQEKRELLFNTPLKPLDSVIVHWELSRGNHLCVEQFECCSQGK